MADGDADDDDEDSFQMRRRDALSLPLSGVVGYGALTKAVDRAAAERVTES